MLVVTDPDEVARLCNNSNKHANLPKWAKAYLITEAVSFLLNAAACSYACRSSTADDSALGISHEHFQSYAMLQCLQRAPHYTLFGTPDSKEWKSYRKTTNMAFSPENMRKVHAPSESQHEVATNKVLLASEQTYHWLSRRTCSLKQVRALFASAMSRDSCAGLQTTSLQTSAPLAESASCAWQAYPKIHQAVLRGSHALEQLCKHGSVDVSNVALGITAGDLFCILPLWHAESCSSAT